MRNFTKFMDYLLVVLLAIGFLYLGFGQAVFGQVDEIVMRWGMIGGGAAFSYLWMVRLGGDKAGFSVKLPIITICCASLPPLSWLAWEGNKLASSQELLFFAVAFALGSLVSVAYFVYAMITLLRWRTPSLLLKK